MYSKELNGRQIRYVKLSGSDVFVPGFGSLGTTLPPGSKTLSLYMEHTQEGVYINVNNSAAEATIPWANVQVAVYVKQESARSETKKVFAVPDTATA